MGLASNRVYSYGYDKEAMRTVAINNNVSSFIVTGMKASPITWNFYVRFPDALRCLSAASVTTAI